MFCENCGADLQDPNQKFCLNCGIPLKDNIQLNSKDISVILDSYAKKIWIWHGSNTTTRMKFIAHVKAKFIRDKYGIGYKIEIVFEGTEPSDFKELIDSRVDAKLKGEIQSPKDRAILENEYRINEYITLKLEDERTYIYVNGKRFLQCIRLFLQIPPQTRHLYEEIESIDEAAEVYKQSLFENRIVEGPMARPSRFQNTTITPEQEFWGHCSNLQAWVEHKYDTRVLMSNAAFPLLKKLAEAGDPLARKVFKEEIAHRLESEYPSVVQYLIVQGYISHFTHFEFKNIIDTTNLIKIVSSQPKMLSNFLQTCAHSFPTILGNIVLKILELPEGKENLITASSRESWELPFRVPLNSNPKLLDKIKDALLGKLSKVRKDKKGDILDYIQIIDDNVNEKKREREAKNFEVERAELKKIEKSLNLKTREMLQDCDKLMIQNLTPTQYVEEMKRFRDYASSQMAPIRKMIYKLRDKLKRKLIELGKIKNKGEDVSDLISQAKDLISLTHIKQAKMTSISKDIVSGLLNSIRKNNT